MSDSATTPDGMLVTSATTPHYRYTPSWVDWLTRQIDRLPGSPWLVYVAVWLILFLFDEILRIAAGKPAVPSWFIIVFYASIPYTVALIHWLDHQAGAALRTFSPALSCDEVGYRALHYRLTTIPASYSWLATALGLIIGILYVQAIPLEQQIAFMRFDLNSPTSIAQLQFVLGQLVGVFINVVIANLLLHTWHQLRIVAMIYREYTQVNLLKQQPLYAFANLSASTAIGILILTYTWTFASLLVLENPIMLTWAIVFSVICFLTFITPLLGIHNLLNEHKSTLLAEINARLQQVTTNAHQTMDAAQTTDIDPLYKMLQTIDLEYQIIQRIPTWPWSPEVPRTVLAALLFPILLWLIQWVLDRVLTS
jgi:hypothetical protein